MKLSTITLASAGLMLEADALRSVFLQKSMDKKPKQSPAAVHEEEEDDEPECDAKADFPKCNAQIMGMFSVSTSTETGSLDQPAGGSNPEAVEQSCQSQKHPWKCMMMGEESGCAWSMHPDCGPAVGSCVAWASGGGGNPGVETSFTTCADWKQNQIEMGKTGACPDSKEDKDKMVEKLYCGKGLPKEFEEERKKADDMSECKDGDVAVSKNSPLAAGVEMWPEVFFDGKFHPICGHYFWDNNHGAKMFCKKLGFSYGGRMHRRNKFEVDSMPVGKCGRRAAARGDLAKCHAGGNAWGNFGYRRSWCGKGKRIGVSVICAGNFAINNKDKKRNSCGLAPPKRR